MTAVRGDQQADVSWSAPGSDGGSPILSYTATSSHQDGLTCTTTTALGCIVTGLTNGLPYTFTVTATNANGTGLQSTPVQPDHPCHHAHGPTSVLAAPGDQQVNGVGAHRKPTAVAPS